MNQLCIPGYEILEVLGQGGMATVYRAIQQSLGREVAIKIMHQTMSMPGFSERFLKEAQIIAGFNHPHIIIIHDVGLLNDRLHYLSMEYVKGGDLKQRIQKKLNPLVVLLYIEQLAECLVYIHQRQVVHRDIKPANVLFRENSTLVLTDFGIAKQLEADSELTATGSAIGSPHYLSPEQAEGKVVDGRSDIYSLGVLFYEMLTGSKPYQGDSYMGTVMMHISAPVPVLPTAFEKLQPLLTKMMAKDREERFANAKALLSTIKKIRERLDSKQRPLASPPPEGEGTPSNQDRYSSWLGTIRKAQNSLDAKRQAEKSSGELPVVSADNVKSVNPITEKTVASTQFVAAPANAPVAHKVQKLGKTLPAKRSFWRLLLKLVLLGAVLLAIFLIFQTIGIMEKPVIL